MALPRERALPSRRAPIADLKCAQLNQEDGNNFLGEQNQVQEEQGIQPPPAVLLRKDQLPQKRKAAEDQPQGTILRLQGGGASVSEGVPKVHLPQAVLCHLDTGQYQGHGHHH